MVFKELLFNISLVILMGYLYSYFLKRFRDAKLFRKISLGILFGGFSVIAMMMPLVWNQGLIFDGRSILLSLAALFGGVISGTLALIPVVFYRLWLGGYGALVGVMVTLNSVLIGILARVYFKKFQEKNPLLFFYTLGLAVHIAMVLMMLALPGGRGQEVFNRILLPVMLIYPLATLLIGIFFREKARQIEFEQKMLESEEKFRALAENAADVIMRFDREHRHLYVNPSVQRYEKIRPEDFMGKTHRELGFPESLCSVWEAAIDTVFSSGENFRLEFELPGNVWMDWLLVPERDKDGHVSAVIISARDVSENKNIQELLIQNEKMVSLGNLAAGMAHEINNPLGIILLGVQNILRRLSSILPENQRVSQEMGIDLNALKEYLEKRKIIHYLTGMKNAGEKAAEIVRNMLGFVRSNNGSKTPVQIIDVIEHSLELLKLEFNLEGKYDFNQLLIIKEYEENLPLVPCTQIEMEQVFLNLFKNAAQALHEKNGASMEIKISAKTVQEMLEVSIADNGPGMDPLLQKKMFEPFFTTKQVGEGTGLGLSITYFIVTERHQGTIRINSDPGHGSTFTVCLPLKEQ